MSTAEAAAGSIQKIGIRYCGGCNPRYDRGAMVKRILSKHPEWDAENAREGINYDLLLVIGGCGACCAAYSQFTAERIIKLWNNEEDLS